ncbi:hypothetical protein CDAR_605431 [Caerostris darwini]|uniref:Uncharacterized protein n=1 Tax=Caerostris darwini TaxID=1538125 RepID=A0AAV4NCP4_9ARAC|nr:hypothetical protein CDAR_605431 [Caerostris darwini]
MLLSKELQQQVRIMLDYCNMGVERLFLFTANIDSEPLTHNPTTAAIDGNPLTNEPTTAIIDSELLTNKPTTKVIDSDPLTN